MFGFDKKKEDAMPPTLQDDIISLEELEAHKKDPLNPELLKVTRRDMAMLYLGMALELRITAHPMVQVEMIPLLTQAIIASIPEFKKDEINILQKNVLAEMDKGSLVKILKEVMQKRFGSRF